MTSETRWPASVAVACAIVIQVFMPEGLTFGPRWLVPSGEGLLLLTLILANPRQLSAESRDLRVASLGLTYLIVGANTWTLVTLMQHLLRSGDMVDGRTLIYAGAGEWATGIVAFALLFWELDRGGPVRKFREGAAEPDFRFTQMDDEHTTWVPRFVDYLYVSLTNSTAFSPTDTLPLSHRAKLLMGYQGIASLATIAVVGARAVNILN
jgi:hypothetical protein